MTSLPAFEASTPGATPLFLDTSGLYPYFYDRATQHETISDFFEALARNDLPYRPLFTNQYVADELVSLLLSHAGYQTAARALSTLMESTALTVLSTSDNDFDRAAAAFFTHTDQEISLTDHLIGVQADENDVEHILAYDEDFETLGLTVVPRTE